MTTHADPRRDLSRHLAGLAIAALAGSSAALFTVEAKAFEITEAQREACMGDAIRLCGSEIPDVDRVLVCMRAKKSQVSAHCRATIPRNVAAAL